VIEYIVNQDINLGNVLFLKKVPQLKVLEKADLFITHGGFGGIKEAIFYKVPMLVYPLDMHYDQNGNAFKIEHFGLGKRGKFGFERLENMKTKISELLENQIYKINLSEFKINIHSNYTKEILNQKLEEIGI
jgi:UDP:flavonoid glycosyltransferase YjiC (YdhE family)